MSQLKIFIQLTRLNRPIGYMLLFWPCSWGLSLALLHHDTDFSKFFYYLILFFLGSLLMRSAGCIVNDIVDKDIDLKVSRTKDRPLPSGKTTVMNAMIYVIILCLIAFFILIQFNKFTIILGLGSMIFAFSYPFMKRITYWPQLFLGLTFNWGIVMAWTSITNDISSEILLLYFSAIFWTLGYDTIYGAQDIKDDEIIGVKSTSIKFKSHMKLFVSLCYLISVCLLIFLFKNNMGFNLFTLFLLFFVMSLIFQIKIFSEKKPKSCLLAFKLNNLSGLILFFGILTLSNKIIL